MNRSVQTLCRRTLLLRFVLELTCSEFNIYLRAAALSSYLDYAVVPDSRNWIYGDLREFFLPPHLGCALPTDTLDRWALPVGVPGWRLFPRVSLSRRLRRHALLDRIVRAASVDLRSMRALRAREAARRACGYRTARTCRMSCARRSATRSTRPERIWRPNAHVHADVDSVRDQLGLQNATRARPIIAIQVRLGDKEREQRDIRFAGSHIAFGDMRIYLDAAREAAARLHDPLLSTHPFPLPTPTGNSTRPLLVVMTAEAVALEALSALDVRGEFEIIASPAAQLFSPSERAEHAHLFSNASKKPSRARRASCASQSRAA